MSAEGQQLIGKLNSLLSCAMGIKQRLERIEAELKPLENRAAQKGRQWAVDDILKELAKYTPLALFGIVSTKVNDLGNSLDNLRYTTNQLGERVTTTQRVANQAKVATDNLGRVVINHGRQIGFLERFTNKLKGITDLLNAKFISLDVKLGGA